MWRTEVVLPDEAMGSLGARDEVGFDAEGVGPRCRPEHRVGEEVVHGLCGGPSGATRLSRVAPRWRSPMWSAQAEAERLTLLVADNKAGYFLSLIHI